MRGPPGSGKSSLVKILKILYAGIVTVCSADDYFTHSDGSYHFDTLKLKIAHQTCQQKAQQSCRDSVNTVVIDNTNICKWEMREYLRISKLYNYVTILVEPKTDWRENIDQLATRNSHGVTAEIIKNKVEKFEEFIPFYYGWFINSEDSKTINHVVCQYIDEMTKTNTSFQTYTQNTAGKSDSLY